MSVSTHSGSDQKQNAVGLALGHAFTVLGTKQLSNGAKLVHVRNPWGKEKYHGPWSDASDLWTPELKQEAGLTVADDGEFFIDIDTFHKNTRQTYISYNMDKMHRATFLKLNDAGGDPGSMPWCGKTCSRHDFTFTSATAQKVIIKAQTWEARSMSKACKAQMDAKKP